MADHEAHATIDRALRTRCGPAGLLEELKADGFELYRPEDCELVFKFPTGVAAPKSVPIGSYRLVPHATYASEDAREEEKPNE